jgi:hypothetical protein
MLHVLVVLHILLVRITFGHLSDLKKMLHVLVVRITFGHLSDLKKNVACISCLTYLTYTYCFWTFEQPEKKCCMS